MSAAVGDRGMDGLVEADGARGQVGHVQPQVVHLPPLCVQRLGGGGLKLGCPSPVIRN